MNLMDYLIPDDIERMLGSYVVLMLWPRKGSLHKVAPKNSSLNVLLLHMNKMKNRLNPFRRTRIHLI